MQKKNRQLIIQQLWERHRTTTEQIIAIENGLRKKDIHSFSLDHFAVIDLPGPHTGIPVLSEIFSAIGYVKKGQDYLAEKQNDFVWMAECDNFKKPAREALPQVVVADFRFDELPPPIQNIIAKYAKQSKPVPLDEIKKLADETYHSPDALRLLSHFFQDYFKGRDWALPTVKEFETVCEFNELLAWALVSGRRPNHFTLSIHLLTQFKSLEDFHQFIEKELSIPLNQDGGKIKGNKEMGISQGSTIGVTKQMMLRDGSIELPGEFVEFVWRYPHHTISNPYYWHDYFDGFIAQNANRVIESLYERNASGS